MPIASIAGGFASAIPVAAAFVTVAQYKGLGADAPYIAYVGPAVCGTVFGFCAVWAGVRTAPCAQHSTATAIIWTFGAISMALLIYAPRISMQGFYSTALQDSALLAAALLARSVLTSR